MNKTSQTMIYKTPDNNIKLYFTKENNDVPNLLIISVECKNIEFDFQLDERFNTIIAGHLSPEEKKIYDKIERLYNELKRSKVEYGIMGMEYYYEYEPIERILIEDFINYIKRINRDNIINKIIDE
jgi:hypothetical protein